MANQYIRAYELEFGVPHRITENSFVSPIKPFVQTGTEEIRVGTTFEETFPGVGQGPTPVTRTVNVLERNPIRAEERAEEMDRFFASNNYSFRKLTDHQITFNIDKNKESGGEDSTNGLRITIYNASDNTVGYLEQNAGKKPYIRLKAGYVNNIKTIFKGNVEKIEDDKTEETRKTTIHCSDGGPAVKEALSFRSYPKGTSVDAILNDLIDDLGLPRGSVSTLGSALVTNKPLYFTGNTARSLARLSKALGMQFSIHDTTVNLAVPLKEEYYTAAVVTPETGLIGAVSFLDENKSKTTSSNTKEVEESVNKEDIERNVESTVGYQFSLVTAVRSSLGLSSSDRRVNQLQSITTTASPDKVIESLFRIFTPEQIGKLFRDGILRYTGNVNPITGNGGESSKPEAEPRRGVKFRTLLNGSIVPEKLVAVEAPDRQGNRRRSFYKAIKVKHSGDFEGNTWYTDVEAEWVDPSTVKVGR